MKKKNLLKKVFLLSFFFWGIFSQLSHAQRWEVTNEWSSYYERAYQEFIVSIGQAVEDRECNNTDSCLKSSANPYRHTDRSDVYFFADCADLPYVLRAYFAWKNQLPFSFIAQVRARPGGSGDIRYSRNGNVPVRRRGIKYSYDDAYRYLRHISNDVSTAMFRVPYWIQDDDFYAVDLSVEGLVPGTMVYDPNGHVAIIYKIASNGKLYYIDAHPDNSITQKSFGPHMARSRPEVGAGFKKFRSLAARNDQWHLTANEDHPDYSTVQFYGTHPDRGGSWSAGKFYYQGQEVDYYDYIRHVMSLGNLRYNPLVEFRQSLKEACRDLQDRVASVEQAVENGIHRQRHPERLPRNIYGTSGDWESYSTPSRDARIKTSLRHFYQKTEEFLDWAEEGDDRLDYPHGRHQLKNDLKDILLEEARDNPDCTVVYQNSNRRSQSITLSNSFDRVYDWSFDPYHCPELRWGAPLGSQEFRSCPDSRNKVDWYRAERRLRNQTERDYERRMDLTLRELEAATDMGPEVGPELNLYNLLN